MSFQLAISCFSLYMQAALALNNSDVHSFSEYSLTPVPQQHNSSFSYHSILTVVTYVQTSLPALQSTNHYVITDVSHDHD